MAIAGNDQTLHTYIDPMLERIRELEAQLAVVCDHLGLPYERRAEVPERVVELVRSGDRIGAMRAYRELTGASAEAARDVIQAI